MVDEYGTPLPEHVLDSIRRNKVGIKGPITTPVGRGFRSVNVAIRKALDLYANLRPAKTIPGVASRYEDIDLVIVRENTEGLYAGIEHDVIPGEAAEAIRIITRRASERDRAFCLRVCPRQWPQAGHGGAQGQHPEADRRPVPARGPGGGPGVSRHRLQRPHRRQRCACSWCSARTSTMCWCCPTCLATSSAISARGWWAAWASRPAPTSATGSAVFEPVHGSAPKYTGQNKVNPTATIRSGALMLRHLGEIEAAERMETAVAKVIAEGKIVTYDLKADRDDPTAVGTQEMADAIIAAL